MKKPGRTSKKVKLPALIAATTKHISVKFKLDQQTNQLQFSTAVLLVLKRGKKVNLNQFFDKQTNKYNDDYSNEDNRNIAIYKIH